MGSELGRSDPSESSLSPLSSSLDWFQFVRASPGLTSGANICRRSAARTWWMPAPGTSKYFFSTALHNKNLTSCDERPLLRVPESASSLHAQGLSQPVLHHPSPDRL